MTANSTGRSEQILSSQFTQPRRRTASTTLLAAAVLLPVLSLFAVGLACGGSSVHYVVTTLVDAAEPPEGAMTLRKALELAPAGETITFAPVLNGGTIELDIVGNAHSTLKAEVYVMDTVNMRWVYLGYEERDFGKSALYANKNVIIDASALADGITVAWAGEDAARVMAVYGNLTMTNVTIKGGNVGPDALEGDQPYTLGRGGGLAVWGVATLTGCVVCENSAVADLVGSRDRGAFGGGIYADVAILTDCIVSGNSVEGYGASGGGIFSVGGVESELDSTITRCVISGNSVTGEHAYGGGIFTNGGGIGQQKTLFVNDSTIARNSVQDNPDVAESQMSQYYCRGGGMYMSNGSLSVFGCTVTENTVSGWYSVFSGKPNIGGGGFAATIGTAHTVEKMTVGHSIVVGNTISSRIGDEITTTDNDIYSGSLIRFDSTGYNLVGALDFSQILVPVPSWTSLSRKHWPKVGDVSGVIADEVLALADVVRHSSIISKGADEGEHVVMYYPPTGDAVDAIPAAAYTVEYIEEEYILLHQGSDDFIMRVLERLRTESAYSDILGTDFGEDFGDLTGVGFYGPNVTWQSNTQNDPWVAFWKALDVEIAGRLGVAGLNDEFFGGFATGPLGDHIDMMVMRVPSHLITMGSKDVRGHSRPENGLGDIGAYEQTTE
ncbi:MAG: hypothetical protein WC712_09160 [Candidatus Brocadiia bacterium]